jgi:hypothetical protein
VETVEDVTFLVSSEDDLYHMGLEAEHVAKLWPALQSVIGTADKPAPASQGDDQPEDAADATSAGLQPAARETSLGMGITEWLAMHGASACEEAFRGEDVETVEDVTFLVSSEDDLHHMGLGAEHIAKLWQAVQHVIGSGHGGDDGDEDEEDGGGPVAGGGELESGGSGASASGSVSLWMGIAEWLAMHGASACEEAFREEDVETVEDVTFLVSSEDDLQHMGLEAEHVAKLWPAVLQLPKHM